MKAPTSLIKYAGGISSGYNKVGRLHISVPFMCALQIHGFARTVIPVFDVFTCSGSYVTRPLVGKKRMLTDMRDVRL